MAAPRTSTAHSSWPGSATSGARERATLRDEIYACADSSGGDSEVVGEPACDHEAVAINGDLRHTERRVGADKGRQQQQNALRAAMRCRCGLL